MVSLRVCVYVCVCMCVCVCDTPGRHAVSVDDHRLCLCLYVYVYVYICVCDTPEQHAMRADSELVCLCLSVCLSVCVTRQGDMPGVLMVNLGKNKTADAIPDYVYGVKKFKDVADMMVVNISSPNTPVCLRACACMCVCACVCVSMYVS